MKRFFDIVLTALSMLAVALLSAFISMRLAIHGREVEIPNLAGLTLQEASARAGRLGLSLHLENKFYSADTPSGHILAQSPAPGATVRREWTIRITESIGPQQVSIPDLTGQSERPASLTLRRSSLELGTVARIAAPGASGTVLAQTPPPNASGVDRPRVSILVSQPSSASPQAFVMPQLTGLPLSTAFSRTNAAGLRIARAAENLPVDASGPGTPGAVPSASTPQAAPSTVTYQDSFFVSNGAPSATPNSSGTVIAQSPPSGHRVVRGDSVRLTISH